LRQHPCAAAFSAWWAPATLGCALGGGRAVPGTSAEALPSRNDTGPKKAIVVFVKRATTFCSTDFVLVPECIAVVDNDGRL
jgi:hypothetical protein